MGIYRFILSYCVLHSHVFGPVGGWNIGVVAVISFIVMSGYVMTLLIDRHYAAAGRIGAFYLDRAARLFPQYLLYLALTLAGAALLGLSDPFLENRSLPAVLANVAMLPVGFYMFGLENALYVPPAWSLGLELSFYLVFPFFLLAPAGLRLVLFLASVAVFLAAVTGRINSDWFGYRLLPGTFFMFVVGACLARASVISRLVPAAVLAGAAGILIVVLLSPRLAGLPYNREVLAGLVLGIVVIFALSRHRFSRIDELFGSLAYGVFLNHFLAMWLLDWAGFGRLAVPAVSLAAALVTYKLVEEPALRARLKLRRRLPQAGAQSA